VDDLFAMVRANAGFVLGRPWLDRLGRLERWRPSLAGIPTVAGDGRMLPQDWIHTAAGWLKTDAVDHHDDHFFPGTQDIAWDLAGTAAEFRLSDAASESLAAGLAARLRDATLPRRLPFYRMAYLAFRLGYASLAADTLAGTPDGRRMAALAARYGIDLREAIMRLGQP